MSNDSQFHRIRRLPPYVFSEVNALKARARAAGRDIIDLGMGNPDMPTPKHIVDKLVEAVRNPRNHRYSASRGITRLRKAIEELAELDFLERAESVVLIGNPGVGKSGLASAIVLKALYAGRTARAITAQNLFEEFEQSQADRSTKRLIKRLSSVDLLLIDEFGYVQARTTSQVNQLFRLMDNRASRKSTIITSYLGFEEWGSFLGEKALTAMALIFASFLIRPTPFCILDEIDAPLDEENIGRFTAVLRDLSQTAQFIVITHSKHTMSVADSLFGVTMEEPGVSKMVSIQVQ
jgi:predicted ATPase